MHVKLLHLDSSLEAQSGLLEACQKLNAQHIDVKSIGSKIRLWGKDPDIQNLQAQLKECFLSSSPEPSLVFMGSGDFHSVTSLLLASILRDDDEPITVLHFDNHPDWVHHKSGIHCGSWVNNALEIPAVKKVITIGVCSDDLVNPHWKGANLDLLKQGVLELYPYQRKRSWVGRFKGQGACFSQERNTIRWQPIVETGMVEFIDKILSRIETKNIYITIDKDVLLSEGAITNWDQGQMTLPYLLKFIRRLKEKHNVIGADVTGDYSPPEYKGDLWSGVLKRMEALIDQPKVSDDRLHINQINTKTNLALLQEFTGGNND